MDFELVNKAIIICAKRNSGKSYLCRYLVMENQGNFNEIFVVSLTEDYNNFYKSFVKTENIFTIFQNEWLEAFFQKLKNMAKTNNNKKICLILDDCGSNIDFKKNSVIESFYTLGRHINLTIIINAQYIYQVSPAIRNNADYIMIGQQNSQALELLADEYLYGTINRKEFKQLYHNSTTDYYFMVINTSSVRNISNLNLIYGKIKTPKEFMFKRL